MGKASTKGRYITKVGFYDIYAQDSTRKKDKERGSKTETSATVYNIYHAKKLVEKGLKTKDEAVKRCAELAPAK